MSFNSKYSGQQVENLLDQVANGSTGGGGGGITTETDPIFSASPAATITNENIDDWNGKQDAIDDLETIRQGASKGATALQSVPSGYITESELNNKGYATTAQLEGKVDKVDGKQLSTEDFTTILKQKLEGLSNYDDTEIQEAVSKLRTDLDTLVSGDTTTAIKTFNEVIAFLDGLEDTEDLASIIASIELQIAAKGTYSKPSTGIPKSDLASDVQTSLGKADTALQSVPSEFVTETELNNKGYATSSQLNSGFGNIEQKLQQINGELSNKQPTLVSGTNIKTINGNSILGSGNLVIEGGSGGSSGSSAYPLVNHGTSDRNFFLTPNTFHVWDEVASLDLSFADETAGVANEYLFQFTSGATATTLTLPDGLKWANDSAPTIAENMIYQISVLKGLASVLEFSNAAALIENHGTYIAGTMASGATLTFEYPVASDLTIGLIYAESETIVLAKGQSSITIDWIEPAAPAITSIEPLQDDTYIYIV